MTWCSSSRNRKKTKSYKPTEINDVLNRRYSCRAFAAGGVEQEKVDRILDAAIVVLEGMDAFELAVKVADVFQ